MRGGSPTRTSDAIYDCLRAHDAPLEEARISEIPVRPEPFRRRSVTAAAATGAVTGLGLDRRSAALEFPS